MAVVIWLSSIWKYNYISRSNFFNRSPKKLMEGKEKREVEKGNEVAIFFLFWNSPRVQIHHLSPMLVPLILQHSGPKNCAQQKTSTISKSKMFFEIMNTLLFHKKKTLQTILIFLKNLDMIAISGWQLDAKYIVLIL